MSLDILTKYLKKVGAKSYQDLNELERETYEQWKTSLSGRKLTDEEVKQFLDAELEATIEKLIKESHGTREDTFLKMRLDMVRKIKHFLYTPELEKKVVEQGIKNLLVD